jgi:hypothetical protein
MRFELCGLDGAVQQTRKGLVTSVPLVNERAHTLCRAHTEVSIRHNVGLIRAVHTVPLDWMEVSGLGECTSSQTYETCIHLYYLKLD